MTELLIQSNLAAGNNKKLSDEAARIRKACQAEHGKESLVECPGCLEKVLEALRSRYLQSPDQEWFTARHGFLRDINNMVNNAHNYQLDPRAIDRRIKEERSRWYAENVRASLLRLMVEDPARRETIVEKLEEPPSDITIVAREIAEILSQRWEPEVDVAGVAHRLASAKDDDARLEVIREAFFGGENGEKDIPANHQKYFDMLKQHNLSMEQVVDRILEDRQAALGAREQTEKLKSRLDELKRARAAHELQKTRKAKVRASSVEKTAADELYKLPQCIICGELPSTRDFFCCPICAIFVGQGVQEQQTVYCTSACRDKGFQSHMGTHICSSEKHCIEADNEDTIMGGSSIGGGGGNTPTTTKSVFCSECTTSLKIPTVFCTLACASRNFQRHREQVHLPERKKQGIVVNDEDQLICEKDPAGTAVEEGEVRPAAPAAAPRYRAKDITTLTIPFRTAVSKWEEQTGVSLGI